MVLKMTVVGIGPGNPDYLIPAGKKAIDAADVVVGGKRALADFVKTDQKKIYITGNLPALAEELRALPPTTKLVVLVSGDPGYYSLLPWLKRTFPESAIKVIPGLSSIQVAFSRLGETWQDADLLSFHGRVPPAEKLIYATGRKLAFLTDAEHNPAFIAGELMRNGWPKDTFAAALERISYEDERIVEGTLQDCTKLAGFAHSVLVVIA